MAQIRAGAPSANFFLDGNFSPVNEERDTEEMEVIGTIPDDLKGHFLRVGPNPVYVFSEAAYHTFDGDGMIHAMAFSGGKVRYRNRFIRNEGFKLEQAHGDWLYKGMNSLMDPTPSALPQGAPGAKNLANTAFAFHNNTLYALHEPSQPTIIDLPSLATRGPTDFDGKLTHPFTAHPKIDKKSGEMMAYGYSFQAPFVTYSVINKQGDLVHSTPITIPRSIFMHDFAVTEKYTLFLDFPITLDIGRAISGGPAVDFEPQYGSRIGVMPRYGSDADVRWFDVKTGVVIHTANAWDEGDEVVLQASRSNTADIAGAGTSEGNNLQENQGQLYEWRINLISGEVTERNLSDTPCDFTRVNDHYACFKTRYVYAGIFNTERAFTFDGVMKYDNESGVTAEFRYGPHRHGGEAVFAPRVGSASEDDGYLVCFIHDEADNQSECLIIDAQTIEAGPVATIMMPFRVPYGFHAGWVST
jgi:carotenoid cleavage dioxygenase-like enzyme